MALKLDDCCEALGISKTLRCEKPHGRVATTLIESLKSKAHAWADQTYPESLVLKREVSDALGSKGTPAVVAARLKQVVVRHYACLDVIDIWRKEFQPVIVSRGHTDTFERALSVLGYLDPVKLPARQLVTQAQHAVELIYPVSYAKAKAGNNERDEAYKAKQTAERKEKARALVAGWCIAVVARIDAALEEATEQIRKASDQLWISLSESVIVDVEHLFKFDACTADETIQALVSSIEIDGINGDELDKLMGVIHGDFAGSGEGGPVIVAFPLPCAPIVIQREFVRLGIKAKWKCRKASVIKYDHILPAQLAFDLSGATPLHWRRKGPIRCRRTILDQAKIKRYIKGMSRWFDDASLGKIYTTVGCTGYYDLSEHPVVAFHVDNAVKEPPWTGRVVLQAGTGATGTTEWMTVRGSYQEDMEYVALTGYMIYSMLFDALADVPPDIIHIRRDPVFVPPYAWDDVDFTSILMAVAQVLDNLAASKPIASASLIADLWKPKVKVDMERTGEKGKETPAINIPFEKKGGIWGRPERDPDAVPEIVYSGEKRVRDEPPDKLVKEVSKAMKADHSRKCCACLKPFSHSLGCASPQTSGVDRALNLLLRTNRMRDVVSAMKCKKKKK